MFRFLAKPRWIVLTVFAVAMVALCIRLGFWQLDRLEGRRFVNDRLRSGMSSAPEPVETLIAGGDLQSLILRQASAQGRYDADAQAVLYGRPLAGRPGNHVLTPLVLGDGRAVIVDRGWVPFEPSWPPVAASDPPSGTIRITGLLEADAGTDDDPAVETQDGRVTVLSRVDLETLQAQVSYELLPMYMTLRSQVPAQGALPELVTADEPTDGPHLGYALQWFAFASIAAIGWAILARREVLDRRVAEDAD